MRYLLALTLFIYSQVFAQCPAETDLVSVELPQFGKNISFCQKIIDGSPQKHGPLIELKTTGEVIKKEFYLEGKLVTEEAYLKNQGGSKEVNPKELDQHSLEAHKAISSVLQSLSRVFQNDLRYEGFEYRGCQNLLMTWLRVLATDQAHTFKYEFKEKCDINGTFQTDPGKKLSGNIQLRNLGIFNQLQFNGDYQVGSINQMDLHLTIKDGILIAPKGKILFDFDGKIYFNATQSGLAQDKDGSTITFTNIFGMKVNLVKPFYSLTPTI